MKLTTVNDKIQIVLGGAITTNQLQCLTTWKVYTTTTTTDGKLAVNTNSTTDVDLAGAPAKSTSVVLLVLTASLPSVVVVVV